MPKRMDSGAEVLANMQFSLKSMKSSISVNSDEKTAGASKGKEISQDPVSAGNSFEEELYNRYELSITNLIEMTELSYVEDGKVYILQHSSIFRDKGKDDRLKSLRSLIKFIRDNRDALPDTDSNINQFMIIFKLEWIAREWDT